MMKPISQTAFYCCGVRMQDAESEHPLCGDNYARRFMNEAGLRILAEFAGQPHANDSNVGRHRIIDDLLRRELAVDPNIRIVIIGAGFDSRAYRLPGGRWVELDEPQVIAYKNERLPVSECENELQRIPIDFSIDSLADKLAPFAGDERVLIVVEGVLMYLKEDAIKALLGTLRQSFPQQRLICDLMTSAFFEEYGKPIHETIVAMGAPFQFIVDDPEAIFRENGYCRREQISIVAKSLELRRIEKLDEVLKTLPSTLVEGYAIYVFEPC